MRCLLIFVKCLNFLGIFLNVSQGKYLQEYLKSDFENRAQFVEHLSSFLNKENIAFVHVFDSMACVHQCISHSLCYSVNFAIHPEDQGHRCELLPTDKYRYPYNFEKNVSYRHYSIVVRTSCSNYSVFMILSWLWLTYVFLIAVSFLVLITNNAFFTKTFRKR